MMADSVEHVISYWVVFQKFQSPALGGYAVLSHWLPMLFFGVFMGALADRYDSRRLIQIGMLLFMACSLAWRHLVLHRHRWKPGTPRSFSPCTASPAYSGDHRARCCCTTSSATQNCRAPYGSTQPRATSDCWRGPRSARRSCSRSDPPMASLLNAVIYLPLILFLWKAPYGPRFQKVRAPARPVRGALRHRARPSRSIRGSRIIVSMILLSGARVADHQQRLSGADAELCPGSGSWRRRPSLWPAARRRDAAGALTGGIVLEAAAGSQPRPQRTRSLLVMIWCCVLAGLCHDDDLSRALALLFAAGFVELSYSSMAQAHGAAQRARRDPRAGAGLSSMAGLGLRAFRRHHGRTRRQLIGIHWCWR